MNFQRYVYGNLCNFALKNKTNKNTEAKYQNPETRIPRPLFALSHDKNFITMDQIM